MFLSALMAGLIMLRLFAPAQFIYESEPGGRSALLVAAALNRALDVSSNPAVTLEAFASALNSSNADALKFQPAGTDVDRSASSQGKVPAWFIHLMALPDISQHAPIFVHGKQVGDLIYEPDPSADIHEKWIGFLAIMVAGIALMLLTVAITYFTVHPALKPLHELGQGLARLREGHYADEIVCSGPPEIRESCEAANELAHTLLHMDRENRVLLRKMVSVQDDERRDIARELHDELGPLLFTIRANVAGRHHKRAAAFAG
jgi:two-component system sensor histidine kinase UhpB